MAEEKSTEKDLTSAANYYIRNRKTLPEQNTRAHNYVIDQNISLLERTAEAYGVSIQALAKKVRAIDSQPTRSRAA